jgi:Protein of unknown function (DUF2971)
MTEADRGRVYYKYRELSDFRRFLQILFNQKMYAARFTKLNDPMEGVYLYEAHKAPEGVEKFIKKARDGKLTYGILSLSEDYNNMLMWSHYAKSHEGVVIGVKINDPRAEVFKIEYTDALDFPDGGSEEDNIKLLLLRKAKVWEYEKEVRVLTKDKEFVGIEICELFLGYKIDKETEKLIMKIAEKLDIQPKKIVHSDLNAGFLHSYDFDFETDFVEL